MTPFRALLIGLGMRLVCWLAGHRWRILRENGDRSLALMHLHTYAGCDCVCKRCGAQWLDSGLAQRADGTWGRA